jgi:hypothetical protein
METFFENREFEGRYEWLSLNMRDVLRGRKVIQFTLDPYCPQDFEMTAYTSSTTLSYGEIKTIHRDYTKYENFQINYKKMKRLQDRAKKDGRVPYLVCFFDDYKIVWDITDIDFEARKYTQYCTPTTAFYTKEKEESEQVWLTKEEALWSSINDKY